MITVLPVILMCMVFFQCLYLSEVSSLVFRILIVCRRDLLLLLLLLSNTVVYQSMSRTDANIDNDSNNISNLLWEMIMHRML